MSNLKFKSFAVTAAAGLLFTAPVALRGQSTQLVTGANSQITEQQSKPIAENALRNKELIARAKEIVTKAIVITDNAIKLATEYNKTAKGLNESMSVESGSKVKTINIPNLITVRVATSDTGNERLDVLTTVIITYNADKRNPNQQAFFYQGTESNLTGEIDRGGPWVDVFNDLYDKAVAVHK